MNKNYDQTLAELRQEPIYSIGLIVKIPKNYLPGRLIINLVVILDIQLNLLGMLMGCETDKFNWLSLKITGTMDDLIATLIYLHDLGLQTTFFQLER